MKKGHIRLTINFIISVMITIALLIIDDLNQSEWNFSWMYPLVRVPLVLYLCVSAFMATMLIIYIVQNYDK